MLYRLSLNEKKILVKEVLKDKAKYLNLIEKGYIENNIFLVELNDDDSFEISQICMDSFLSTLDNNDEPTGNGLNYDNLTQRFLTNE